MTAERN